MLLFIQHSKGCLVTGTQLPFTVAKATVVSSSRSSEMYYFMLLMSDLVQWLGVGTCEFMCLSQGEKGEISL